MPLDRWVHLTRALSAVGIAVFAVVTLAAPQDGELSALVGVWGPLALLVFACMVAGSHAYLRTRERAAWIAITLALVSWTIGEQWYTFVKPQSFPSVADAGYIGIYPLLYVGIVLLLREHARSIAGALWLDGITAALAAAALGAAVLVELVLETTEGPLSTVATNLAYPLGDVLLLSAVFGVFSLTGWRPGQRWLLLGLGMLALTLADAIFLFQTANGTYVRGTWVDILWPAGMLAIASAAWAADRGRSSWDVEGRPLLAVPVVCALVSIGVLAYDRFHEINLLAFLLAVSALVLVILRLGATFRENHRLFELARREASTDALTELANRRQLLADLDRRLATGRVPALLMIFDLDGFKGYNDVFGHPAGDALLTRLASKLEAVVGPDGKAYRLGGDEFCLVVPIGEGSEVESLIDRSVEALSEHGEGFDIRSSFGAVRLPDEATDTSHALQVADGRLYAQKYAKRGETDRTTASLLEALAARDPDLEPQHHEVSSLALAVGRTLELRRDELAELTRAAQLHDLGKLAVPDEILRKPGPLDEREWAFVRQHTIVGERILQASSALRSVASIVRSSHEWWDGTGYPDGLAGEKIPLASRIVCACDAYVAMTSSRTYRDALSHPDALNEMMRLAGTQFDPAVVRVLVALVRDAQAAEQAA